MYYFGHGVDVDYKRAFDFYESKYLDQIKRYGQVHNFNSSLRKYVYMLLNGLGCKADPDKAMSILKSVDDGKVKKLLKVMQ